MEDPKTKRSAHARRQPNHRRQSDQATRQRLLEAAGQVFADKGFNATTGKEICELAKTNTAAINYYFGGVDGLYAEVLAEARDRLLTTETIRAALAGKTDAKAKLEAVIGLLIRALTGPVASSWAIRVLGREVVSPSPVAESWLGDIQTRVHILRSIVGELIGLPEDHPIVARGCFSVIGPCLMLVFYDRRLFQRVFPGFGLTPDDAPAITRQMLQFVLGGLAALAADVRQDG
jgi:AcrR family transcriptional regulator